MGKNLVNREKLLGAMAEKKQHYGYVASTLGISKNSLSYKIKGKREFKESEIYTLVVLFGDVILTPANN
jgi:hypothetical protein